MFEYILSSCTSTAVTEVQHVSTSSNTVHVLGVTLVSPCRRLQVDQESGEVTWWRPWVERLHICTHTQKRFTSRNHTHTQNEDTENLNELRLQQTQEQQMLLFSLLINARANWRSICLQTEDGRVFHSHDRLKQTEEDRRRNSLMEEPTHFPFYATWIQILEFLLIYNSLLLSVSKTQYHASMFLPVLLYSGVFCLISLEGAAGLLLYCF